MVEDHVNGRRLAEALATMPGISIDPQTVEANLVYFEVDDASCTAQSLCDALRDRGAPMLAVSPRRVRAVTHLDGSRHDIERTIRKVALPMILARISQMD